MEKTISDQETLQEIPIDQIKILENSRIRIEESELTSLMKDIKHRGLLQPIGLTKTEKGEYVLRYGQRRLEACKKLRYKTISAIVSTELLTNERFISDNLAENLERVNLTPLEFARVCKMLLDDNYSIGEMSVILNQPEPKIKTALSLLQRIPEQFKSDIRYIETGRSKKGKLSATVANQIVGLRIKNHEIEKLMMTAKQQNLSSSDITLISSLLKTLSFKEAVEKRKEYKIIQVAIPMKINELEKYKEKTNGELIKNFISGRNAPNKSLVS